MRRYTTLLVARPRHRARRSLLGCRVDDHHDRSGRADDVVDIGLGFDHARDNG